VDLWPDRKDPAWRAECGRVERERDKALWRFYVLACLPGVEPPAGDGWLEEQRAWGIAPRPGPDGRKLDWIEYHLLETDADLQALRAAFRDIHDVPPEARQAARLFFNLKWDDEPIHAAAEGLKSGKLSYAPGWAQFQAAERWRLLPLSRDEAPPEIRGHLPLCYYDLPPALRARMEEFCESLALIQALHADEQYRRIKYG
jgi:hypothetical protein